LQKLWWGGCKRFTSGHGIAGTVSGVEVAIHCDDELWWFSVGIEVSLRDQRSLPLASAGYRYANAIATPASTVQR